MRTDETGCECPATLGEYRDVCAALASRSSAVHILDALIARAPHGRDELVIASDAFMRAILFPALMRTPGPLDDAVLALVELTIDTLSVLTRPGARLDRCRGCGRVLGLGLPVEHVGICERCGNPGTTH